MTNEDFFPESVMPALFRTLIDRAAKEAGAGAEGFVMLEVLPDGGFKAEDMASHVRLKRPRRKAEELCFALKNITVNLSTITRETAIDLALVNALSSKLSVEVHSGGQIFAQTFLNGIPSSEMRLIGDAVFSGSVITFYPDKTVFKDFTVPYAKIREFAAKAAGMYKKIKVTLKNSVSGSESEETF